MSGDTRSMTTIVTCDVCGESRTLNYRPRSGSAGTCRTCSRWCTDYADEVVVDRLTAGIAVPEATYAERVAAGRILLARRMPLQRIAERIGVSERTVQRWKTRATR